MRVQLTRNNIAGARLLVGNQMEAPPCKAPWPLCLGCSATITVRRPLVRATVRAAALTAFVAAPASAPRCLRPRQQIIISKGFYLLLWCCTLVYSSIDFKPTIVPMEPAGFKKSRIVSATVPMELAGFKKSRIVDVSAADGSIS